MNSADSSRNAGYCGRWPRSFRNAETGVSQSSMKRLRSGMTLCSRASSRTSSSEGSTRSGVDSIPAAAIEHLPRVGDRALAPAQQDGEVVQDIGRLVVHALVGLLARGARDLLGLLHLLVARELRVVEQLDGVRARGALGLARRQRALEHGQSLVRRGRLELAVVEAGALAGVTGRAVGLDQRQHGVAVAVDAQRADLLRVARCRALVPQLVARAAPQVQLTGLARARERLLVGIGEGEDLSRPPVLDDDRDEAPLVETDVHPQDCTCAAALRRRGSRSRAGVV